MPAFEKTELREIRFPVLASPSAMIPSRPLKAMVLDPPEVPLPTA